MRDEEVECGGEKKREKRAGKIEGVAGQERRETEAGL